MFDSVRAKTGATGTAEAAEGKGRGAAGKGLQLLLRSWRVVTRGARRARRAARVPRQWFIGFIKLLVLLVSYYLLIASPRAPARRAMLVWADYYFIGFLRAPRRAGVRACPRGK